MKRTNLFIDQALLKQVMRALGVRTYSAAVNLSLTATLRVKRVQALPNFFGKGLWEGDLAKMREDRRAASHRKPSHKKTTKKDIGR